jgi:hypothetical protein
MKKFAILLSVVFLTFALSACAAFQPEPTPTATLVPSTATSTPIPPTATPEPTVTVTHTVVPTETPQFEFGEKEELPSGGFSFQPIKGYETESNVGYGTAGLFVSDNEGTIMITFNGVTTYHDDQTPEEIINEFLSSFENKGIGEYEQSEPYPIVADEVEGIAVDVNGTTFDRPIEGQTVLIMPSDDQFLFGLAIGIVSEDRNHWQREGSEVFSALMEKINFIDGQAMIENVCEVSVDATYGYTKDNPIKVAGHWMEGPARERAYLDSLCGPDGETISYQRLGSEGHGDTILDKYEVTYEGMNKTFILYIDMYEFEPLMAPVGFKCWVAFPLSEPK